MVRHLPSTNLAIPSLISGNRITLEHSHSYLTLEPKRGPNPYIIPSEKWWSSSGGIILPIWFQSLTVKFHGSSHHQPGSELTTHQNPSLHTEHTEPPRPWFPSWRSATSVPTPGPEGTHDRPKRRAFSCWKGMRSPRKMDIICGEWHVVV